MFSQSSVSLGLQYFIQGWYLISQKGLRRFVVMPILINILLLSATFFLLYTQTSYLIDKMMSYIPDWLSWLGGLLMALSILLILIFFYFIFVTLAGFIAAPFNALLAEKVEEMLTGEIAHSQSAMDFIRDIPRIILREWQKLKYSLPRLFILFLFSFIPLLGQSAIPILSFVFSAWLMAIQYCDYPFDNHKITFAQMKQQLAEKKLLSCTFGILVTCCTFIPLLNFVIIPVAVCGATVMWVEQFKQ
ncbi:sulfate transporter CysZ [[Haemophilus] felis]|uniref:Sulfate transporter CysZ n=1 Tax=[Haemophilus] felis TaxID=123822 RepID=A0A1T0B8K2_9PAST|nr:sulfate transporter CysZ [[Haemophilus] felis]NBI40427.1 sulfate transporter CysZ [[Haemophilus] felis]OOS06530.1 sulfate transporter CysZ [[Haemophilus] felis]